jgi:SpoIID/LytB domain protein
MEGMGRRVGYVIKEVNKLNKRILSIILTFTLCMTFFPFVTTANASTISVKLINYIGNTNSISFTTTGNYKLANGNIRIDGKDRFAVAINIAENGWNHADTVVVVNYLAFADALAATPLAYKYDAPILLTRPDQLTIETKQKIQELRPNKVIIVGGTGSVSSTVGNELKSLAQSVERIGGKDRFEVAKQIANRLGTTDTVVVANGLVFADALSIAPYAARKGYPILLTKKDQLPSETRDAIQGKTSTIIIGGEGSVSNSVASQLPTQSKMRIGGKDRYEVAANIIRELNFSSNTAFISTGLSFADALTGSVLAAKQNAPLLLTRPNQLPDSILAIIKERNISSFTILGGTASVSDSVVSKLPNELRIEPGPTYFVKVENGKLILYKGSGRIRDFGTSSFTLVPDRYGAQNQITLNNQLSYLGKMEFFIENGAYVRPINRDIPYEDYLKGVVPHEMPASWPVEALKAQAVAARTYSIDDVGKVVPDTQAYQVYGGYKWYPNSTKAVVATAGQVLRYNGKLIDAVFSSSNGGHTESNANAWGGTPVSYLPAKPDPYDPQNPWEISMKKVQINVNGLSLENPGHWWWSVNETNKDIANSIKNWMKNNDDWANKEIKIISINNFSISPEKTSGQRSKYATIHFDYYMRDLSKGFVCEGGPCNGKNKIQKYTFNQKLSINTFRSMFGTSKFKSNLLDPVEVGSDYIKIKGRGYGHGVGMSQYGANVMASKGFNYKLILEFYYPGATLGK